MVSALTRRRNVSLPRVVAYESLNERLTDAGVLSSIPQITHVRPTLHPTRAEERTVYWGRYLQHVIAHLQPPRFPNLNAAIDKRCLVYKGENEQMAALKTEKARMTVVQKRKRGSANDKPAEKPTAKRPKKSPAPPPKKKRKNDSQQSKDARGEEAPALRDEPSTSEQCIPRGEEAPALRDEPSTSEQCIPQQPDERSSNPPGPEVMTKRSQDTPAAEQHTEVPAPRDDPSVSVHGIPQRTAARSSTPLGREVRTKRRQDGSHLQDEVRHEPIPSWAREVIVTLGKVVDQLGILTEEQKATNKKVDMLAKKLEKLEKAKVSEEVNPTTYGPSGGSDGSGSSDEESSGDGEGEHSEPEIEENDAEDADQAGNEGGGKRK